MNDGTMKTLNAMNEGTMKTLNAMNDGTMETTQWRHNEDVKMISKKKLKQKFYMVLEIRF